MVAFTGGNFSTTNGVYYEKIYSLCPYGSNRALGTSVALSALMHALDAIIALGAIGTATYLLWDYLDDEPTLQSA